MNWTEFAQWSLNTLGIKYGFGGAGGNNSHGKAVWGRTARNGAGSGHSAEYSIVQQRRLATWQRVHNLVEKKHLAHWIDAGETRDDGWLVNDGTGIRWVSDPAEELKDLLNRGFVAVKCGVPKSLPIPGLGVPVSQTLPPPRPGTPLVVLAGGASDVAGRVTTPPLPATRQHTT